MIIPVFIFHLRARQIFQASHDNINNYSQMDSPQLVSGVSGGTTDSNFL